MSSTGSRFGWLGSSAWRSRSRPGRCTSPARTSGGHEVPPPPKLLGRRPSRDLAARRAGTRRQPGRAGRVGRVVIPAAQSETVAPQELRRRRDLVPPERAAGEVHRPGRERDLHAELPASRSNSRLSSSRHRAPPDENLDHQVDATLAQRGDVHLRPVRPGPSVRGPRRRGRRRAGPAIVPRGRVVGQRDKAP